LWARGRATGGGSCGRGCASRVKTGKWRMVFPAQQCPNGQDAAASLPCQCCCPAAIPPYFFLLLLLIVLYLPVRVQGGSETTRVSQRRQRDVQGAPEEPRCRRSHLGDFCQHVLRKFLCVCGSLSVGAFFALAPEQGRRGIFYSSLCVVRFVVKKFAALRRISPTLRELFGHPSTAHHSYAFPTFREG